ncbi:hypothetical protein ACFL4C_03910 [Candidatus Omnitrophota bacterium]
MKKLTNNKWPPLDYHKLNSPQYDMHWRIKDQCLCQDDDREYKCEQSECSFNNHDASVARDFFGCMAGPSYFSASLPKSGVYLSLNSSCTYERKIDHLIDFPEQVVLWHNSII